MSETYNPVIGDVFELEIGKYMFVVDKIELGTHGYYRLGGLAYKNNNGNKKFLWRDIIMIHEDKDINSWVLVRRGPIKVTYKGEEYI